MVGSTGRVNSVSFRSPEVASLVVPVDTNSEKCEDFGTTEAAAGHKTAKKRAPTKKRSSTKRITKKRKSNDDVVSILQKSVWKAAVIMNDGLSRGEKLPECLPRAFESLVSHGNACTKEDDTPPLKAAVDLLAEFESIGQKTGRNGRAERRGNEDLCTAAARKKAKKNDQEAAMKLPESMQEAVKMIQKGKDIEVDLKRKVKWQKFASTVSVSVLLQHPGGVGIDDLGMEVYRRMRYDMEFEDKESLDYNVVHWVKSILEGYSKQMGKGMDINEMEETYKEEIGANW